MVLLGWSVRLTIRDGSRISSILFYATPLLALMFACGYVVIGWLIIRRIRVALVFLLVGVVTAFTWHQSMFVVNKQDAPSKKSVRILFWNVGRGRGGWDGIISKIKSFDADVICIAEGGFPPFVHSSNWETEFPQLASTKLRRELLVMTRGKIVTTDGDDLVQDSHYRRTVVEVDTKRLEIIIVDVHSDPTTFRKQSIESVAKLVRSDRPQLLVGDFNTPSDSKHWMEVMTKHQDAFDLAGNGYRATWPVPVPMMQLDYAWVNEHIRVEKCELGWSWRSDHRPVLLEIDW